MKISMEQILLDVHINELGLVTQFEWPVMEGRKWRFDIACPNERLAFECNGGKWSGGHRRGKAIEDENDKINTAQLMGWRVLQFTNEQVLDGRAKAFLAEWLKK